MSRPHSLPMSLKAAFCSNHSTPFYESVLRALAERLGREAGIELMEWEGSRRFPLAAVPYLHPDIVFVGAFEVTELADVMADSLVVGFSNAFEETAFPRVVNHDREVGRSAAMTLLESGYRQWVVFVDNDANHARQRVEGIRDVAGDAGIPVQTLNVSLRKVGPRETFQQLWKEHASSIEQTLRNLKPNTGILATSALSASEILETLGEFSSLKIPEDLGVIVTDSPQVMDGNLAHVALDSGGVANTMVDLVLRYQEGRAEELPTLTRLDPVGAIRGATVRVPEPV